MQEVKTSQIYCPVQYTSPKCEDLPRANAFMVRGK